MMPADWTDRYLSLLGVEHETPSLDALTRLVRAHVLAVPFENVTAHLRRRAQPTGPAPQPDPTTLLDSWEQRSGGGVCFDISAMVAPLLDTLGYRAQVVLGQISAPFGHQAIVVDLDDGRYLVDLGNGAPLFAPIPMAGEEEIHRHGLSFRYRPGDTPDTWIQDRQIGGEWKQHCLLDLRPAADADRDAGYQRHMTPGTTWVLGSLTMNRSTLSEVYALKDDVLTRYTHAGKHAETIASPARYREVAAEVFGLPNLPIEAGLEALAAHRSATPVPGS
jgi:N-hydroxyarylamine O-acetyltransferase